MHDIDVSKAVITVINIIILLGLPGMFIWHVKQVKRCPHLSPDWMIQILILFVYMIAISAEIPALVARWIAYYELRMKLPQILYMLSTWDRWNHLFFYVALFLLTHTFTKKQVPQIIRDFLS